MAKSSYTPEQRQEAVRLYGQHGPAEASRRTGIPARSIRNWASRAGVTGPRAKKVAAATEAARASFQQRRYELRGRLLEQIHDVLERMNEPHQEFKGQFANEVVYDSAPAGAMRDYATTFGILLDKLRLELGEATGRHENVNRGEVDGEIDRLLARLAGNDGADAGEREHGSSDRAAV